ncbi:MAG: type IX secretion system outer membrane channel protein PorV [Bacteroidales bacterium]|nr:type IX secretion system outer membrane channel protein PorV [Bacteroidales bacterium]
MKNILMFVMIFAFSINANSQITTDELSGEINTITTAVPFLVIAPDSRSGGMGEVGVATTPDANSMHWNPAKYGFIDKEMGLSISFTPWLSNLVDDIYLGYLSYFKRLDKNQVVAASLLYFSLGDIVFTDIHGDYTGDFNPHEFSLDLAYSRVFSKKVSSGLAARYIYSNLTGPNASSNIATHPGKTIAMDVSVYYNDDIKISDYDSKLAFGMNISNIGAKISYTEEERDFIPINLRLGSSLNMDIDEYNSLAFSIDINKLMVPTPNLEGSDTVYGKDENVSVPVGMFQSFYDAPGILRSDGTRNIFKEEIRELTYSVGAEYWYSKQFAIRAGYFHEHATKGNRKFATIGLGLKLNVFGLDFAYLIPTNQTNSPLANTLRFTLVFDFETFSQQN